VDAPIHADGLKSSFLGAFYSDAHPTVSKTILAYADGTILDPSELASFVEEIAIACTAQVWSEDREAKNRHAINECIRATLDDVKAIDVVSGWPDSVHYQVNENLHWPIWKVSGLAMEDSEDEMVEFLRDKDYKHIREAQAALGRPKSAANPRRSALPRHAELKRRLMR